MVKKQQSKATYAPVESLSAIGSVRGVFFSLGMIPSSDPQLDCAKAIIGLFTAAKKAAHVAIFMLTESRIADAMITLKEQTLSKPVTAG